MIFRKLYLSADCKYESDDTKALKNLLIKRTKSRSDYEIGGKKSNT